MRRNRRSTNFDSVNVRCPLGKAGDVLADSPPPANIVYRTMQNGEEHLVEDFDLFWGMGPSRNSTGIGDGSEKPSTAPTSRTLNPSLMGSLWAHGGSTLEAYGHRHHMHAQPDTMNEVATGLGSLPSSHRSAWLPAPSSSSSGIGNDVGTSGSITPAEALSRSANRTTASGGELPPNGSRESVIDSKIEELAAAISLSLANKLEPGVKESLQGQGRVLQYGQSGGSVLSSYITSPSPQDHAKCEDTAGRAAESATAPLRSRLAALEEKVSEFRAALERKTATTGDHVATEVLAQHSHHTGRTPRPEYTPRDRTDVPLPRCSRSLQQTGKGGGGNRGGASVRCGNGGSIGAPSLEESIATLAQRTGTLEGRHKQVQAKVALLDNAFGSKASDWAQTIKSILAERDKLVGGGVGKGGGIRSAANSGKKSVTSSSQAAQTRVGGGTGGSGNGSCSTGSSAYGGYGGTSKNGAGTLQQHRKGAPTEEPDPDAAAAAAAALGAENDANQGGNGGENPDVAGGGGRSDVRRAACEVSDPPPSMGRPRGVENTTAVNNNESATSASTGKGSSQPVEVARNEPPPAGSSFAIDRCAHCDETGKRCAMLEARMSEWEKSLLLFQKEVAAAAANAHATSGAVKSLETAAAATAAAAERSKLEASGGSCRQEKTPGSANWASKSSVDKLASDLRHVSERMKDGEDALAFVDHGLKGVRDRIDPFAGSLAALKRLVETHLREKEQAAEMLKGYVTTITREVVSVTRRYINTLITPGRPATSTSGESTPDDSRAPQTLNPSPAAVAVDPPPASGPANSQREATHIRDKWQEARRTR